MRTGGQTVLTGTRSRTAPRVHMGPAEGRRVRLSRPTDPHIIDHADDGLGGFSTSGGWGGSIQPSG